MSLSSARSTNSKGPPRDKPSYSRPDTADRPAHRCGRCKHRLPAEGCYVQCSGCSSAFHFECTPLQKHAYCAMSEKTKQSWRCPQCRRRESINHKEACIQTARMSEDDDFSPISNKVDVLDLRLNIMINDLRSEVAFLKNEALTNQKITYFVNMQCEELKKELCDLKAFVCEQLQQQSAKRMRDTVDLLGVGQQVGGSLVIGQNGNLDYECHHRNSTF